VDRLKIKIQQDTANAGKATAQVTGRAIQEPEPKNDRLAVIFATGAFQLATLNTLIGRPANLVGATNPEFAAEVYRAYLTCAIRIVKQ